MTNDDESSAMEATSADLPPVLYTLRDIARFLNVSRSTVRRMKDAGQIPHIRVRGQLRFDLLAVRAAIDRAR